jgi:hypothetical protein
VHCIEIWGIQHGFHQFNLHRSTLTRAVSLAPSTSASTAAATADRSNRSCSYGLMDDARHVIKRILTPRFLS